MGRMKWGKTQREKEKCRRNLFAFQENETKGRKIKHKLKLQAIRIRPLNEKEKILSMIWLLLISASLRSLFLSSSSSVRYLALRLWFGLSFQINVLLQSYTFLRAISSFAYAKKDACISSSLFSQSHCHFSRHSRHQQFLSYHHIIIIRNFAIQPKWFTSNLYKCA